MNKTYLLWFAFLAFLLVGCRNENFNPNDTNSSQQALKFRVVPRSEIPQIINVLQAKTNFIVPLKNHSSTMGKTETVFGEINTNYIIETTNETNEVFYTFPITPNVGTESSETYNLVVKTDPSEAETSKVLVYEPSAEWILNGNNNYLTFSGNLYTYSLDGNLESTVAYLNGTGNCEPEPCPDCPPPPPGGGNPHGPGGGDPGGGTGTPPGTGGPVSYPGNGGSSSGGGDPCGDWVLSQIINQDGYQYAIYTNKCGETLKLRVYFRASSKAPAPSCDQNQDPGGGVVITIQNEICAKTKAMVQKADVKPKLNELYEKSKIGGEKAFMVKNDGMPGNVMNGDEHSVTFDMTGNKGVYHNHTPDGIKMVSPRDIYVLLGFVKSLPTGTPSNDAFVGMVGSQPCAVAGTCPPDGYESFNYIVRFTDTPQNAGYLHDKTYDFDALRDKYRKFENEVRNKSGNGSQYGNYTSHQGVEKVFFYTLSKMGIDKSKMILQRIDKNGNVTNVTLGADGKPKDTPCQ